MLLSQIYNNASNAFSENPELRNLLLATFNQAEQPASPFSVENLANNPLVSSPQQPLANVDPRTVGGVVSPWAAKEESIGPQTTAPGKSDKLMQFQSEPITPDYLATLDQAGRALNQPQPQLPQPQVAAAAPQYGPGIGGGRTAAPANMPELPQQSTLSAFLTGLGSSDAILPALGGAIQNVENLRTANIARNQTYRALVNRGLDPTTAIAAVTNPEMMKTILPSIFSKLTQIGEDRFGNKIFGFPNAATQNATAVKAGVGNAGFSSGNPSLHGEDYLKSLNDPAYANQLRKYASGDLPIPTGFALKSPYFQRLMQDLTQFDPNFSAVNYGARFATRKNFTSGPEARNITSFNTTMQHLGVLEKAIDALNNTNYPLLNKGLNIAQPELGNVRVNSAINNFNIAKNAVVSEMTRAFRGTGGNVHDLLEWSKTLDPNQPPEVLKDAIKYGLELLHGRVESLSDQYNRGMGTTADPLQFLSPKARSEWGRIMGEDVPSGPAVLAIQPPEGQKYDPTYYEQGAQPTTPQQGTPGQPTQQRTQGAQPANKQPTPADYGEMRPGMYQENGRWLWKDPKDGSVHVWSPPQ